MAKFTDFFLTKPACYSDRKPEWRDDSKRTLGWWTAITLGATLGGLLGSLIPIPVLGTLIGIGLGSYFGAVVHNKLCDALESNGTLEKPTPINTGWQKIKAETTAAKRGFVAGCKSLGKNIKHGISNLFSRRSEDDSDEKPKPGIMAEASDAYNEKRHKSLFFSWMSETFIKGPSKRTQEAYRETGDFFEECQTRLKNN